jgi:two-component system chemotaxis response regulator CheB
MMPAMAEPWFIAIGASGAQGLSDIRGLLSALPAALNAVVMVVLHRPSDRISNLRIVLAADSPMPVVIAEEGERLEPGVCYIGEPADHLTLAARSLVRLVGGPDHAFRNRTIDLLFASVAAHAGKRMIGVILSGALDDGSRGLAAIHAAGGLTMVLTPDSLGSPGMPENAISYDGPVDLIGSFRVIAAAICDAVGTA